MITKAYFMIDLKKESSQDGRMKDIIADLQAMPEVNCIEPIDGACDLLVEIEAPIRIVFIANKLLTKDWIENLRILKVKPFPTSPFEKLAVHNIVKARRRYSQSAMNKPLPITRRTQEPHTARDPLCSSNGQRRFVLAETEQIIKRRT